MVKNVAEDMERRLSFQERPSMDLPYHSHEHQRLVTGDRTKTDTTTGELQRETIDTRPSEVDDILMQLYPDRDQAAALEIEMAALSPRSQAVPTARSARGNSNPNKHRRNASNGATDGDEQRRVPMYVDTRNNNQKHDPRVKQIDEIHVDMDGNGIPPPLSSRARPHAPVLYESDIDEISSMSDASAVVGDEGLTPMPMTPSHVRDAFRMRSSEEYMPPQLQDPGLSPPHYRAKGERKGTHCCKNYGRKPNFAI